MAQQDTDQWWRERRSLARKLLDQGKFLTAYQVVQPAARRPTNTTGPTTTSCAAGSPCAISMSPSRAREHFARIDEGQANPTVLSRANYWRGRAAEALGDNGRDARML